MPDSIQDGSGSSYRAKVDASLRLRTQTVQESEADHAAEIGNAYNINTKYITISAGSALLYLKNLEDQDYILDSIALGVGQILGGGAVTDEGEITFYKNPTGGDLLSGAVADIVENRNAGSGNTLNATVLKGADGDTVTGGTELGLFQQGDTGRFFASFRFTVPKNSSIALHYEPNLSSGSIRVYAAFIGHLKDESGEG
jgi:hypothetical protein